jgi:hypothetical protein
MLVEAQWVLIYGANQLRMADRGTSRLPGRGRPTDPSAQARRSKEDVMVMGGNLTKLMKVDA